MLTLLALSSKLFTRRIHMAPIRGPRPLVICGPSGSGKSTLLRRLFQEFPNTFQFCVSHTTRQPRAGEKDGIDYYFVTKDEMVEAIAAGSFIETTVFCGNTYGTSKMAVREVQSNGKVCILDIDLEGVEQVKKTDLNPVLIFNNPPSIEELKHRLNKRGTETDETLNKRLAAAETEIAYGLTPGNFHKVINNVDIDAAYEEFRDFIVSELEAQEAAGIQIFWNRKTP